MFDFLEENCESINVNELKDKLGKVNLIDIREKYEFDAGHLPTAVHIPMDEIMKNPEKYLKEDEKYYIICHSGRRSLVACNELVEEGYDTVNVEGGTVRYNGKLER